jgi:hypothetical protein
MNHRPLFLRLLLGARDKCYVCGYTIAAAVDCPECGTSTNVVTRASLERMQRVGRIGLICFPIPIVLWVTAVANDRTDLGGFPGTAWVFAWLSGVILAPLFFFPLAMAFAFCERQRINWLTTALWCAVGTFVNALLAVATPLVLYYVRY